MCQKKNSTQRYECVRDRRLSLDTQFGSIGVCGNIYNFISTCTTPLVCVCSHAGAFALNACQVLDKVRTHNFIWFLCLTDIDAFLCCVLPFSG